MRRTGVSIIKGKTWHANRPTVYIGVYNSNPEEGAVNFSIKMRDSTPRETFSPQIMHWNQFFESAVEGIDANDTSVKERKARDLMEVRSFTYGEVTFASFLSMIYQVRP